MCNCAPMLLSRDFLRLMQLMSGEYGHAYIEQILTGMPPSIQYGKMPSCETERWVFTLGETLWLTLGIKPYRVISQRGMAIDLTPEGHRLSLRLAALSATGRSYDAVSLL